MLEKLIQKYARLLSVLSVLMAAFAAPYLVPENPDSAALRSGTLAAVLLLGAIPAVYRALRQHSLRTLIYGSGFAFVLLLCMGVGNELRFYDQLLPGFGSLIRRFAAPALATPVAGSLFSYIFAHTPKAVKQGCVRIPYIAYFLLFAICYTLVLLAFYPGVICYDFEHEYAQFVSGVYQAAHPVFHTLFLGGIYHLGKALFGSLMAGAALYSMVQLLLLAAMYAYACTFIQRRINRPWIMLCLAAGFAFLPFHGVLAISTAKDPLFTGLCLLLVLWLWEIAEDPAAFLTCKWRIARFSLCCLLMALLRHNGVFAYAPACLAILLLCRGKRIRAATVCAAMLLCALLIPKGLEAMMHANKTPSSEMMSVPCQQLMRTAARADLPQEERDEISAWFSNAIHRYNPHCADAAKGGNFDFARYQADPSGFWSMYFHYAKAQPRVYIEAFLENCAALWNPDDTSHTEALAGESYEFVYLLTDYYYEEGRFDLHRDSKLPQLRDRLYRSTHHADHQDTLILAQLFCPATYSFLLLLTTLLLIQRKKSLALCTLPLWGIFLSLLFSAGIFIRYAYPLMTCAAPLFMLAYFDRKDA